MTPRDGTSCSRFDSPVPLDKIPPTDAGKREESKKGQNARSTAIDDINAVWSKYFRYSAVYSDQQTAIESVLDVLARRGYYLKEGACGTGKTLAAVTASVHAMRDPGQLTDRAPPGASFPTYDRTMIVTPVKQQLEQFIGELRGINATLPDGTDPIQTVVMRGQSDMRAISNADLPGTNSRDDIGDLRATTVEAIKFNSNIPLEWPDALNPPSYSKVEYDWSDAEKRAKQAAEDHRFDPFRARAVRIIVAQLASASDNDYDILQVNGVETPYPEHVPHSSEIVDMDRLQELGHQQLPADLQGRFDPFFAATFSGPQGSIYKFSDAPNHVIDRDALFNATIADGRCPHELMGILAEEAEVILGNYNHLLDPETRNLTDRKLGLLDENTIVVVDEAHQLEQKGRDRLSTSLDLYTLDRAHNDLTFARHYATGNISDSPTPNISQSDAQEARQVARQELRIGTEGFEVRDLIAVEKALAVARQELINACEGIEDVTLSKGGGERNSESKQTRTISMEEAAHPEWGDHLTRAIEQDNDLSISTLQMAEQVMSAVEEVYEKLAERDILDRTPQGQGVGAFLRQWAEAPRDVYHPEVRVRAAANNSIPDHYPDWVRHWTPELRLFNCIPRRELRRIFSELGGGVLMSATLRPAESFREATGVDAVPPPGEFDSEMDDEETSTTVRTNGITDEMVAGRDTRSTAFERFPLRFPPENRLSLVADLKKFTADNRGDRTVEHSEMTETRSKYAEVIRQVAQTDGNILIAMPSYAEADWAHEYLRTLQIEKRCLLDKSSSSDRTSRLLEAFFSDGDAILCTSLRGTITEGIDFDGEKLHTCLSVGVPQVPRDAEMNAVQLSYKQAIDTADGLEAAHLIPSTRKVRQCIGRVIRGAEEVGVRIIADERYGTHSQDLRRFLSPQQQQEFTPIEPDDIGDAVSRFWKERS